MQALCGFYRKCDVSHEALSLPLARTLKNECMPVNKTFDYLVKESGEAMDILIASDKP